jgi:hypothetical protein
MVLSLPLVSPQLDSLQPDLPQPELSTSINFLEEIVFGLVRLDLCILNAAIDATAKSDQSLFGRNDHAYIKSLLSQGPISFRDILDPVDPEYYYGHELQEIKIRHFVQELTRDKAIEYVQYSGTLPYLSRLFKQKISLYQMAAARKQVVDSSPNLRVPGDLIKGFEEDFTESDYAEYCIREYNGACIALRFIYNIALLLHDYLPLAIRYKVFDDKSTDALIEKMIALQEHFREACCMLGEPEQDLTWDQEASG